MNHSTAPYRFAEPPSLCMTLTAICSSLRSFKSRSRAELRGDYCFSIVSFIPSMFYQSASYVPCAVVQPTRLRFAQPPSQTWEGLNISICMGSVNFDGILPPGFLISRGERCASPALRARPGMLVPARAEVLVHVRPGIQFQVEFVEPPPG